MLNKDPPPPFSYAFVRPYSSPVHHINRNILPYFLTLSRKTKETIPYPEHPRSPTDFQQETPLEQSGGVGWGRAWLHHGGTRFAKNAERVFAIPYEQTCFLQVLCQCFYFFFFYFSSFFPRGKYFPQEGFLSFSQLAH